MCCLRERVVSIGLGLLLWIRQQRNNKQYTYLHIHDTNGTWIQPRSTAKSTCDSTTHSDKDRIHRSRSARGFSTMTEPGSSTRPKSNTSKTVPGDVPSASQNLNEDVASTASTVPMAEAFSDKVAEKLPEPFQLVRPSEGDMFSLTATRTTIPVVMNKVFNDSVTFDATLLSRLHTVQCQASIVEGKGYIKVPLDTQDGKYRLKIGSSLSPFQGVYSGWFTIEFGEDSEFDARDSAPEPLLPSETASYVKQPSGSERTSINSSVLPRDAIMSPPSANTTVVHTRVESDSSIQKPPSLSKTSSGGERLGEIAEASVDR